MKRILALIACLSVFTVAMFAQPTFDSEDPFAEEEFYAQRTTEKEIIPENQDWEDKNAKVRILYYPMYDEVYIYYETLYVTYDKGQAMNAVLETLEDFQLENNYKHYKYLRPDEEKFKKSERGNRAVYISQVKFSR